MGFGFNPKESTAYGPHSRYGGFYTQDGSIPAIVAYAKDRYITIVPEIEMPGHSVAASAELQQRRTVGGFGAVNNRSRGGFFSACIAQATTRPSSSCKTCSWR